jgi:hypothetical protein
MMGYQVLKNVKKQVNSNFTFNRLNILFRDLNDFSQKSKKLGSDDFC